MKKSNRRYSANFQQMVFPLILTSKTRDVSSLDTIINAKNSSPVKKNKNNLNIELHICQNLRTESISFTFLMYKTVTLTVIQMQETFLV